VFVTSANCHNPTSDMKRNQSRLLLPGVRHHHCGSQQLQKRKQVLGRTIARNRLLKDANPCTTIRRGPDTDLLSMTTSSMDQVEFLNNSTIVSADSHGRIGVHRLALGKSGNTYKLLDLPPLQDRPTQLKLFPFSDASSFAVGLPNGDYQIYSGQESRWSTCAHGTPIRNSSSSPPSFYSGYQRSGPFRRYHRDFNSSLWNCSLDDFSNSATVTWSQITNWETKGYMTRPNTFQGWETILSNLTSAASYSSPQDGWAFWETGSTLYSAFVDPERDCFSIMDHRIQGPVVCYSRPQSNRDDITTCCFVSDHALATAHHSWDAMVPSSSPDYSRMHSVRVWDLRKWNKTPVSSTQQYLPQFPRDSVTCMESAMQWHVSQHDGEEKVYVDQSKPSRSWNRHICINKLVSSHDKSTIMISLQSTDQHSGTDLVLYDYIRDSVTFQHALPRGSVVAVTPSLDHIAVAHTEAGARTKISILDTQRSPHRPSRKRPAGADFPTSTTCDSGADASCAVVVGRMSPELEDNMGIRTRLASLSWNGEGTSFAGGSVDGDLFVWVG
jgi:hypothetical protein